jgi:nucleoside-diphosphate-sugar epimerase
MRVFVAGATGAIGRRLVPRLVARGHDVVAMTRSPAKLDSLRSLGAVPVVADALDRGAVMKAVADARPDVVVHELTALSAATGGLRRFDRQFGATNALRTVGTDNLLAAAVAAGARRFVAQSYAGWPYAREGGPVKTEDDPLEPRAPRHMRETLAAIRHLEEAVLRADGLEGVVLRYGSFYGPGTSVAEDGDLVDLLRRTRFPVVGSGEGVWSFVHIDDAAFATVLAVEGGEPGVYNVVDDTPAPVREWLPELAAAVGAPPPRLVPRWVGWLAAGEVGVSLMTQVRAASNAKAKRALGWSPEHGSWRSGFRTGLRDTVTS